MANRASAGTIARLAAPALASALALTAVAMILQPRAVAQQQIAPQPQRSTAVKDKPFTIVVIQPSNEVPPPDGELTVVLKAQVAKAQEVHRKPYVYFYADWCGPCKALRKSLDDNDPLMMGAFKGTYIIQLNVDIWGKRPEAKVFDTHAIPVLFELDSDGRPTGRKIDGGAWGEDIPKNMAPPLKQFFQQR